MTASQKDLIEEHMMQKIARMLGKQPVGYTDILHILTSVDILPMLKAYIQHIEDLESAGKDLY